MPISKERKNLYKKYKSLTLIFAALIVVVSYLINTLLTPIALIFLALSFILIFLIPIFYKKFNGLNNVFQKECKSVLAFAVITSLLAISTIHFLDKYETIKPYLNEETKTFEVDFGNDRDFVVLNNLIYSLNAENRVFKISFSMDHTNNSWENFSELKIYVPKELVFQHINLESLNPKNNTINFSIKVKNSSDLYNILFLRDLHTSSSSIHLNITYSSSLKPAGKFKFYTHARKSFSDRQESIIINLGDYICLPDCFSEEKFSTLHLTKGGKQILVIYPENYYTSLTNSKTLNQQFSLNTIHEPSNKAKELYEKFSISFLFLTLSFLAQMIIKIMTWLV